MGTFQEIVDLCKVATSLREQGMYDEALKRFQWAIEAMRKAQPRDAPQRIVSNWYLAIGLVHYSHLLRESDKPDEALPLLREAVTLLKDAAELSGSGTREELIRLRCQVEEELTTLEQCQKRMAELLDALDSMELISREAAMLIGRRVIQRLDSSSLQDLLLDSFALIFFKEWPPTDEDRERFNTFLEHKGEEIMRVALEIAEVFPYHYRIIR